ncbi:MAG: proliferating cell nuclear antigen (pcna) [Candidatus Hodarchaeota archaeon]
MFHATLDSTKTWRQIVDALATLLTEVQISASKKGLSLLQYDSSKAAMVDMDLPASIFQEYTCDEEYDICLGVDELTKVSKRMAGDDRLEFTLDETDKRFEIKMIGAAERTFKIHLLTPPEDRARRLSPKFDVKAEMFADAFKQAVKDIGVVSNHMKVSASKKLFTFSGEGDVGEAQVILTPGDDSSLYELSASSESAAMYAMSYLSEITKALSGDTVSLQFTSNKPMLVEFGVAEAGKVGFLLAPRIERR